jgi:hypothetical protein
LPELVVEGLREADARALLDSVLTGPLDERVRDRIVAETRGNPLALLELPRGLTPAELAGGFGLPGAAPLTGRVEEAFRRRVDALPAPTRHLPQIAAANPTGDSGLVCRPPGGSESVLRRPRRRPRPGWSNSAPGSGSGTRWPVRRPTGRPHPTIGAAPARGGQREARCRRAGCGPRAAGRGRGGTARRAADR